MISFYDSSNEGNLIYCQIKDKTGHWISLGCIKWNADKKEYRYGMYSGQYVTAEQLTVILAEITIRMRERLRNV